MKYLAKIDGQSYATDDAEFVLSLMTGTREVSIGNARMLSELHGKWLPIGHGAFITKMVVVN